MLNKKISLVVMSLIFTTAVYNASAQDKLVKEVEKAVGELTQAMLKADGTTLNRLASDHLSYGHSSGKMETKTDFVQTFVSGASVFEDIQLTEQTIQVVDQTAIVRHTLSATTNDPGKGKADIKLGIVLTWVKTNNQWQLLARQAFKLP
jgi:ketosteroid isomerase-like protein